MENIANLHRIAGMFSAGMPQYDGLPQEDKPYMPLLWMDRGAWQAMLAESVIPVEAVRTAEVPVVLADIVAATLGHHPFRWIRIVVGGHAEFMAVLLYEDMRPVLAGSWQDMSAARALLSALAGSDGGRALLADAGAGHGGAIAAVQGADVASWFDEMIGHCACAWAGHGLLCMASDLVRLQVMLLLPGAYLDMGDVAGRLACLPTRRRVGADISAFSGHQTVAIENDAFFCSDTRLMQAIALGVYLWSMNTLRRMARQIDPVASDLPAAEFFPWMLRHIDARMPAVPDLSFLWSAPHKRLASYVSVAHGGAALFSVAEAPLFVRGRLAKERLIDHVGGFTGYQRFAACLAPRSVQAWERCAAVLGLQGYAPQLGWKTYGFGTVNALIGLARLLAPGEPLRPYAIAELERLGEKLGMEPGSTERLAMFCMRVFELARRAHFEPANRRELLAKINELSLELDAAEQG